MNIMFDENLNLKTRFVIITLEILENWFSFKICFMLSFSECAPNFSVQIVKFSENY